MWDDLGDFVNLKMLGVYITGTLRGKLRRLVT